MQSECFCTAIHWWRWLYSHRNVRITVKPGLVHTKGSWTDPWWHSTGRVLSVVHLCRALSLRRQNHRSQTWHCREPEGWGLTCCASGGLETAGGLSGDKSNLFHTSFSVKPVAEVWAFLRGTLCLFLPLSLQKHLLHARQCTKLAEWARI